ncbi:hypothetical protein [uncultured Winogradskyella sp.]|uniref:hypothetical protein n=1 Tax=uncultured Winogradskyella sp. TaxID=395353 RepID=UPI0026089246|nr:hypothetical protein [uncultured Winogradskyella sp.]
MKKIYVILFTVFLNGAFFSCTPEALTEEIKEQACCDGSGEIDPPPPPPPGNGG